MKYLFAITLTLFGSILGLTNIEQSNADIDFGNESSVNINEVDAFTNVVIFIRFADEGSYTAPNSFSFYLDMFNGVDKVSLRDYFLEVSYNQLDITSYLVSENLNIVYYTDTENRSHFEPYDETSNPLGYNEGQQSDREHALLKRAIDYVEDNDMIPDDIELDANDDGDIDSITFMVSGEDNGWNSLLWPHKWSLSTYYDYNNDEYYSNAPMINGKYAYSYTLELLGDNANYYYAVDVGVLAHETFHLISAPDLYHYYDYDWIDAVGDWGLMDNVDSVPSHMLGYMKHTYGNWIDSIDEINASGTYTLYPMSESGDNIYRINTNYSNEYIYLEYREDTGLYESTLPDSGLLVYRVDLDFYDEGNVEGYYDEDGNAVNEVFVFRPEIPDNTFPIEFPTQNVDDVDDDGKVGSAALSQTNSIDEIGMGTATEMFYSDGTEMEYTIYNVVEHDGYITFDISMPIAIDLDIDYTFSPLTDLRLVEFAGLEYNAVINNVSPELDVYYTTDGSTPSNTSTEYTGSIPIDSSHNTIKAIIYYPDNSTVTLEKTFTFDSFVETAHSPYGNMQDITWVLNSSTNIDMTLYFNNQFDLEIDYDYVYIDDGDQERGYTGLSLADVTLEYNTDLLIVNFVSDEYLDDYYGFDCDITLGMEQTGLVLNGEAYYALDVFDTYTDQGVTVENDPLGEYTLVTDNPLNTDVIGEYIITYTLYNTNNEVVDSTFRMIHIEDNESPVVTLEGDDFITLEVGTLYTEAGVTITDNYYTLTDYTVEGDFSNTKVGSYRLSYYVTDPSGNKSNTVTRTVVVVDTTPPEASLRPGVDTIVVGDEWVDAGVDRDDNYDARITIDKEGTVDTTRPGTYTITYSISDSSGNTTLLKRVVTVLEARTLEFVCDSERRIYYKNDDITLPNCTLNGEQPSSQDSLIKPITVLGAIAIHYNFEIDSVEFTYHIYIFIYDEMTYEIQYLDPRRREY